MAALLLAGGQGTRIRALHPDVPKPMIPCRGRPFLEWVVRHLRRQGLNRFVISLGHLAPIAEAYFRQRPADGAVIETVREPTPLGTGGGCRFAWDAVGNSDVLVANADSLLLADLCPAWEVFSRPEVDGVVLGLPQEDASCYGTLVTGPAGRLLSFQEKRPGPGLVNAGVYLLKKRLRPTLPAQTPQSMERDVFPRWLAAGMDLRVVACSAPFIDIGTPESLRGAEEFLDRAVRVNQESRFADYADVRR
jgi:D-glycero-alpha-D-manno-heptose 1-phosphate guanylyltransferase